MSEEEFVDSWMDDIIDQCDNPEGYLADMGGGFGVPGDMMNGVITRVRERRQERLQQQDVDSDAEQKDEDPDEDTDAAAAMEVLFEDSSNVEEAATVKDFYDPKQEYQFDPSRVETDSSKLTVDWALDSKEVGPEFQEVFGVGLSKDMHISMHAPYDQHLLCSYNEYVKDDHHQDLVTNWLGSPTVNDTIKEGATLVWREHLLHVQEDLKIRSAKERGQKSHWIVKWGQDKLEFTHNCYSSFFNMRIGKDALEVMTIVDLKHRLMDIIGSQANHPFKDSLEKEDFGQITSFSVVHGSNGTNIEQTGMTVSQAFIVCGSVKVVLE